MEARVIYAYEKEQDDELNLMVGDVLVNVEKADDGWFEGTMQSTGVRGMFPDNFVEIVPTSSASSNRKPPPPDPAPYNPAMAQPPQIELPPPSSNAKSRRRAKVTYSYAAENEDELSLELDQVIDVISEEEEGWWKGSVNGREGVFPSNFVEPIEDIDNHVPPPAPKPAEKTRPPSMIAMPGLGGVNPLELKGRLKPVTNKSPVPPPAETSKFAPPSTERARSNTGSRMSRPPAEKKLAKVMFSYTASQDDEITVFEGDIVEIVAQQTDQEGWWKVKKGGQEGLVPDNFLEAMAAPEKVPPPEPKVDNPPLPPKKVEAPLKPIVPSPGARSVLPKLPDKIEQPEPPKPELPVKDDLEVPHSGVLDNNFVKQRPKKSNVRPPSKSNLIEEQQETGSKGTDNSFVEDETKKAKPLPVSPFVPSTATPTPTKVPGTKPKPTKTTKPPPPTLNKPAGGPSGKSVSAVALGQHDKPKVAEPKAVPPTVIEQPVSNNEWKEAFESLQEEFKKFKEEVKEDIKILVKDLDDERKKNAQFRIDVDRLKKTAGFR